MNAEPNADERFEELVALALTLPSAVEGRPFRSLNVHFESSTEAERYSRRVRRAYKGAWQTGATVLLQTSATGPEIETYIRERTSHVTMEIRYPAPAGAR